MKRIILLATFVSGLLIQQSEAQTYGWVDISENIPSFPYDTTIINLGQDTIIAGLTDVFFINDNEGWITTYHPFNDTAAILHTTDGGATFTVQTTILPCNAVWMLNANEGYAGGQSGFIYRTIDGGANWNFHGTIANTLTDISFPPQPADTGYACGFNGAVWCITPTGVNNLNSGLGNSFNGISSPTYQNVWICGMSYIYFYNGSNFIEQSSPTGSYNTIYFINNLEGWVAGDAGIIAGTKDGGASWVVQKINGSGPSLFNVFALDLNNVWAVGTDGVIMHTINGSDFGVDTTISTWWTNVVWNQEAIGLTSSFLRGVKFTSPTNGYVVGNNKTLLKYTLHTGIEENELLSAIKISPNPSSGNFQIEFTSAKNTEAKIEIINVLGEKVYEKNVLLKERNNSFVINESDLDAGLYFIRINAEFISVQSKMILIK